MKQTLQLKLSQQLKLTPQLQQSIRLLQLSTLELNQEIERIVQENPLLELGEDWNTSTTDISSPDNLSADTEHLENVPEPADNSEQSVSSDEHAQNDMEWPEANHTAESTSHHDDDYEGPQIPAQPITLREHLMLQVACLNQVSDREKRIIGVLIDSLDDDGYLLQPLDELLEMLPSELGINGSDLQSALKQLQRLDPPGVGACDLQECLVLQLQALPEHVDHREQALIVVQEHLKLLAAHDFTQIKKLLGCNDECLRTIQKLITHLNPKPGSEFDSQRERYIVPDIMVTKQQGGWVVSLNMDALPKLSINRLYANILKQAHDSSARSLAHQMNEAKWLIKNIQQRSFTILRVARAIIERQQQFLEHGDVAMRPLVLREIAEVLNLHESTVSRVTTQKFMHTPRGIFELKYFFGSYVSTDSGGACSATAIRALIKQLVQQENSKKPLSDNKIATLLEQQGIVVARRTIAKYRESLQIPAANLRKSF
ncbi:MAG TPA: RNA polymerase factor sigma-54 [Nitrosomonas sp.]|nr:RNA polymerase factor sigma-54 [Nitrosomonas sp.]